MTKIGTGYYVLKDKEPIEATFLEWCDWFENSDRMVKQEYLANGVFVSTIFLGIGHDIFNQGKPLPFETMIFGGVNDGYQCRYGTWAEAEAGHQEAVNIANGIKTSE